MIAVARTADFLVIFVFYQFDIIHFDVQVCLVY